MPDKQVVRGAETDEAQGNPDHAGTVAVEQRADLDAPRAASVKRPPTRARVSPVLTMSATGASAGVLAERRRTPIPPGTDSPQQSCAARWTFVVSTAARAWHDLPDRRHGRERALRRVTTRPRAFLRKRLVYRASSGRAGTKFSVSCPETGHKLCERPDPACRSGKGQRPSNEAAQVAVVAARFADSLSRRIVRRALARTSARCYHLGPKADGAFV